MRVPAKGAGWARCCPYQPAHAIRVEEVITVNTFFFISQITKVIKANGASGVIRVVHLRVLNASGKQEREVAEVAEVATCHKKNL